MYLFTHALMIITLLCMVDVANADADGCWQHNSDSLGPLCTFPTLWADVATDAPCDFIYLFQSATAEFVFLLFQHTLQTSVFMFLCVFMCFSVFNYSGPTGTPMRLKFLCKAVWKNCRLLDNSHDLSLNGRHTVEETIDSLVGLITTKEINYSTISVFSFIPPTASKQTYALLFC